MVTRNLSTLGLVFALFSTATAPAQEMPTSIQLDVVSLGREYGRSSDLDGDRFVVGADGVAFVYEFDAAGELVLDAELSEPLAGFGRVVAIGGDRVAAASEDRVVMFERQGPGSWVAVDTLVPTDLNPVLGIGIGWLELDGDVLLVGDEYSNFTGAIHVFEETAPGDWSEVDVWYQPTHTVSPWYSPCGRQMALDGDVAVVCDRDLKTAADGTFGGRAYVYERQSGGGWLQVAALASPIASSGSTADQFAYDADVDGDRIVVVGRGSNQQSYDGFVFERQVGGAWAHVDTLASVTDYRFAQTEAAHGVELEGDTLVVPFSSGSPFEFVLRVLDRDALGTWNESATLGPAMSSLDYGAIAYSSDRAAGTWWTAPLGSKSSRIVLPYSRDVLGLWSSGGAVTDPDVERAWTMAGPVDLEDGLLVAAMRTEDLFGVELGGFATVERAPDGTWSQPEYAVVDGLLEEDFLLRAVRTASDRVFVAASPESYSDVPDDTCRGRVAVVERGTAGTWTEISFIEAPLVPGVWPAGSRGSFANGFDVDGDVLAVGRGVSASPGIIGAEVHVFVPVAGVWTQDAVLTAPEVADVNGKKGGFGAAIAVSGDEIWVGAPSWDAAAGASPLGRIYVFRPDGTGDWEVQQTIEAATVTCSGTTATDTNERFGMAIDLDGGRAIVGSSAAADEAAPSGVIALGAVHLLERNSNGVWQVTDCEVGKPVQVEADLGLDTLAGEGLGESVRIAGARVAVGSSWYEDFYEFGNYTHTELFHRQLVHSVRPGAALFTPTEHLQSYLSLGGSLSKLPGLNFDLDEISFVVARGGSVQAFELPTFEAEKPLLDPVAGDSLTLLMNAGREHAGDVTYLVGSATGTSPGVPVPGTELVAPIVWDVYTEYVFLTSGGGFLSSVVGILDGEGRGEAEFSIPPATYAGFSGLHLYHAYVVIDLDTFVATHASNAATFQIE
ncbi:MAG: hypothetical protein R3F34_11175 [Planctomycetota bacterium]